MLVLTTSIRSCWWTLAVRLLVSKLASTASVSLLTMTMVAFSCAASPPFEPSLCLSSLAGPAGFTERRCASLPVPVIEPCLDVVDGHAPLDALSRALPRLLDFKRGAVVISTTCDVPWRELVPDICTARTLPFGADCDDDERELVASPLELRSADDTLCPCNGCLNASRALAPPTFSWMRGRPSLDLNVSLPSRPRLITASVGNNETFSGLAVGETAAPALDVPVNRCSGIERTAAAALAMPTALWRIGIAA